MPTKYLPFHNVWESVPACVWLCDKTHLFLLFFHSGTIVPYTHMSFSNFLEEFSLKNFPFMCYSPTSITWGSAKKKRKKPHCTKTASGRSVSHACTMAWYAFMDTTWYEHVRTCHNHNYSVILRGIPDEFIILYLQYMESLIYFTHTVRSIAKFKHVLFNLNTCGSTRTC